MAIRRIGQILVDLGFLTEDRLEMLLEEQGQIALSMGLITDEQLAQALGEQFRMQVVSLADAVIAPEVLRYITEPMAQMYRVIPLSFEDNTLTIAMCDPQKLSIIDELRASWVTTSTPWWPPSATFAKRSTATMPSAAKAWKR